jgi:hypothetical protein
MKRAHLDLRPTGDGNLTAPRDRLVQVKRFQPPKIAHMLLVFRYSPSVDQHLPIWAASAAIRLDFRTIKRGWKFPTVWPPGSKPAVITAKAA